ncbi:MAG: acyltransferase [Oscillospiraceae bacterium]
MNERPHVDYFDGLRIFAALCVIFMHTAAGPLRAGVNTDWHLLNVCTSLAFTAVPLFLMMSGYLLMTSRKTADISVLLRHRLPRLVVPLAGWTVVAVLWQMFLAHTLTPGAIWAQLVTALHGRSWCTSGICIRSLHSMRSRRSSTAGSRCSASPGGCICSCWRRPCRRIRS